MGGKSITIPRMKRALGIDENKLDKYLAYYQYNEPLKPDELLMLEKYRKAWSNLGLGRTYDVALEMLKKDYGIEDRQARYIISEASYIFGSVQNIDRQGKKVVSANYNRLLSNMARQAGDYEGAGKLWERADRLEGLYDEEKAGRNPDDFTKPAKFVFSNDTKVLEEQQKARERADDE